MTPLLWAVVNSVMQEKAGFPGWGGGDLVEAPALSRATVWS